MLCRGMNKYTGLLMLSLLILGCKQQVGDRDTTTFRVASTELKHALTQLCLEMEAANRLKGDNIQSVAEELRRDEKGVLASRLGVPTHVNPENDLWLNALTNESNTNIALYYELSELELIGITFGHEVLRLDRRPSWKPVNVGR